MHIDTVEALTLLCIELSGIACIDLNPNDSKFSVKLTNTTWTQIQHNESVVLFR